MSGEVEAAAGSRPDAPPQPGGGRPRIVLAGKAVHPWGGQERFLLEMARRLPGKLPRASIHVITIRAGGELPREAHVHRIAMPPRPAMLSQPLFAALASRWIRRRGYDLVHAIGGVLGVEADVVSAHVCHAAWREARRRHGVRDGGLLRAAYRDLAARDAIRRERRAYHSARLAAVTAVSSRTAREIEAHYGPLPVPVQVVPNGIDRERFAPEVLAASRVSVRERLGVPSGALVALFVGPFERKGLDVAIEAAAGAPSSLHLVAVGAGNPGPFRARAAAAGLGPRFHALAPRRGIEDLLAASDVLLHPSPHDAFGLPVVEAMACGAVPIASGATGACEHVEDGVSGFVVDDPRDAGGFGERLTRVIEDAPLRRRMGDAARRAVRALTWDRVARDVAAIHQEVLRRKAAGGRQGRAGGQVGGWDPVRGGSSRS